MCARCSDYRAELKYDDNRPNRVCLDCYTFLTGNVLPGDKEDKKRGILEVRVLFPSDSVCPQASRHCSGAEVPDGGLCSLLLSFFSPASLLATPITPYFPLCHAPSLPGLCLVPM